MSLRNMNIAPRALLGFALIGLLMLGLGIFSLVQMGNIRQAGLVIEQISVPSIKTLDELNALNLRMRTLSYRLLLNREPQSLHDTLNLLEQRNLEIDRARQTYLPLISATDEQAAYDQYVQLLNQYRQLESRMRNLSQADRIEELRDLLNRDLLANSEQINKVM
ncbi:MAG: MCP four helix bundle domain-containing protein, partial [Pseudomonas sp.]